MKRSCLLGTVTILAAMHCQPAVSARALEISILENSDGHWRIEDVTSPPLSSLFRPVAGTTVNIGYTRSAWWLRLDFAASPDSDLVLEVGYTQNDRLDLYQPGSGGWHRTALGDTQPRGAGALDHATPAVVLPRDTPGPVYLHVASRGSVLLPLALQDLPTFAERSAREQFGYGLYYALLLAMAGYNLFLFGAIGERAYLYYVLYLGGLLLFQGAFFGHATQWLWPRPAFWANHALLCGVAITIAAGARFVARLAQTSRFAPGWDRALLVLTAVPLAIPPWMLLDYRSAAVFATAFGAAFVLMLPVPIVLCYLRGCRQARYLALGILSFLPGAVIFSLRTAGVLPSSWFTEHALQLGTAAETMLLSFALADRISILSAEKAAAQRAVTGAHDEERRRIAQDLHDGLGQNLLLLSNRLRRLPASVAGVETLREIADDSIAELRTAARNLHPHQLDRLGLPAALESMMDQTLGRAGIRHSTDIGSAPVPRPVALQVYRIAQEAISNVARHSQATEARLRLAFPKNRIELEIRDNGRGLPAGFDRGFGIAGMRSRAESLGGTISIRTLVEGGVQVTLAAPFAHG